jgi:hypothetical protein
VPAPPAWTLWVCEEESEEEREEESEAGAAI